MRIAIASVFLGQVARGVESWAQDLATELNRRNLDVVLFKGGGPAELPFEKSIPCLDHASAATQRLAKLTCHGGWRWGLGSAGTLQQTSFALRLGWELRRGKFDVVHLQDAWACRVLERMRRIGIHRAQVILGHGTEENLDFLRRLDHVQELAPDYLQRDREAGLLVDRRWFAIPNFVDCQLFSPGDQAAARRHFGLPEDKIIVFESAALKISHKRLDYLITEFQQARGVCPELYLVIAGATTPETAAVERLTDSGICLLKNQPRDDMPWLYRAADIFAHPALREPLGIVFLEAMATGLPCLGHNFPVTQWVIGPGGRTIDMERAGNLSAALIDYCQQPERRRADGTAGRQHVLRTFEKSKVVDQILEMYTRVLTES